MNSKIEVASKDREHGSVNNLNDIISGQYDDNPDMIDSMLDQAAEELESAGLMEKYDDLLNQAADHYTAILAKSVEKFL